MNYGTTSAGETPSGGTLPNLAHQQEFVDEAGVTWRRRGGLVSDKRLRRLLGDQTVRVLHDYVGKVNEVPPDARESFWDDAQAKMHASDYSSYYGAEFKNDDREYLLVIHEDC